MKRIPRLILTAALLGGVALPAPASSQATTGGVSGTVVDAQTGLALAGAAIRIPSLSRASISNAVGQFSILGLPAGSHELQVSYLGYGTESQDVSIIAGSVTSVRLEISPQAIEIEGLEVTGTRRGQAAALNQQLNAINITNVVAADQIGRFPDANIGDAMKRIPGIVVTQDQGEARFGLIRGTEPRLNSVMINGERIPSAEAEVREVQLDLIPSDMVSAVEVNKALTPDMDADAIGGAVNIVTRSAPTERRISATLGSGYNFLSDKAMGIGSAVLADRFMDGRLGLVVSGSYNNHRLGSDNIEAEWDNDPTAYLSEFQIREYQVQRIRRSLSASLDYALSDNSTVTWRSMYNHRDDWENRFRTVFGLDEPDGGVQVAEIERESKAGIGNDRIDNRRLEDQRTHSHSLSGEHLFSGGVRLNWSGQFAQASEERLNERYINFVAEDALVIADVSNPSKPVLTVQGGMPALTAFEFDELTEENQYTRDRDYNARADLTFPMPSRGTDIQMGVRFRSKEKLRDNDFAEYEATDGSLDALSDAQTVDYSNPDFLAGNYQVGRLASATYLGGLNLANGPFDREDKPDEFAPANYNADERILAGYFMATKKFGDNASLLAGVRVENTDIDYVGNEFVEDDETTRALTGTRSYTNVFPSLQLRYQLDPRSVLRAAWTNTISRPNYYALVPYRIINREDNEAEIGNPDLDPTTSMNFDLMYERYFTSVGIISGGLFYKDINDFIFEYSRDDVAIDGTTFDEVSQPLNGGGAQLFGFEAAIQRSLDFLPGALRGLGIYLNYTYTNSSVDGLPIEGREDEDLPLPGTSENTFNASLSWDYGLVSLRGSVNYQGDFIDPGEVGDEAFFDRYYDAQTTIDLNGSIQVRDNASFFFEVNNLTNEPLRYYQGIRSRLMQEEFYDVRFQSGLKIDLR